MFKHNKTVIILSIVIIVLIIIILLSLFLTKKYKSKLKGGVSADPNYGSAVWNELYFSVPKNKKEKLINFVKLGVISANDGNLSNFKEFIIHKPTFKIFDKDNYIINHYRITFFDKIFHKENEKDPISLTSIPFEAKGIEFYNKKEAESGIYTKEEIENINKILKSEIIYEKDTNDKKYIHLRYEQAINAIFEYWFHMCQYFYYYIKNEINKNINLVSDKIIKDENDLLKSLNFDKHNNKINEESIKDNYEILLYNNTIKQDENKFDDPFKKLPYDWGKNDIEYICDLYLIYLQSLFNDYKDYNESIVEFKNKKFNIGKIIKQIPFNKFENCLSRSGYIERLNYFEILKNSNINFTHISYHIEETLNKTL